MNERRKQIVAAGYDTIGERYLEWSSRTEDPARDRMIAELSRRLPAGARILDLGCGAGIPSTRVLAERFAVTGVDISAAQIAAARANVPGAAFIQADLASVSFPDASFDGVTALYAISHVPREEHGRTLERIARWLRPGGLLLATIGARDSGDWVGEWLGTRMFFSSFDADENRRLVAAAGLETVIDEVVETVEPEGPVPFLWILARRPLASRLG